MEGLARFGGDFSARNKRAEDEGLGLVLGLPCFALSPCFLALGERRPCEKEKTDRRKTPQSKKKDDKGEKKDTNCIWEEATKSRVCILFLLFRM